MITLEEVKEWLRIDFDEDDSQLKMLIDVSSSTIEIATGVEKNFLLKASDSLKDLYKITQLIIITDLYNEKSTENKALTSYYIQLKAKYEMERVIIDG